MVRMIDLEKIKVQTLAHWERFIALSNFMAKTVLQRSVLLLGNSIKNNFHRIVHL